MFSLRFVFVRRNTHTLYSGIGFFASLKDEFLHFEGTILVFSGVASPQILALLWNSHTPLATAL